MFTTYEVFKHPVQLDPDSTLWATVEMVLGTPWFIATFHDPAEAVTRTLLFASDDLLLHATKRRTFGQLAALNVVMPPRWSVSGSWTLATVAKIDVEASKRTHAYVTTNDGATYAGFPLEPADVKGIEMLNVWTAAVDVPASSGP